MVFAVLDCRPGTGYGMGDNCLGRERFDRKIDRELIRSGKDQRQKQGQEKRKKNPEENFLISSWTQVSDHMQKGRASTLKGRRW